MSATVTTEESTLPKTPLLLVSRARLFWTSFGVLLLLNLIGFVLVYTIGLSTGFEGQLSFSSEQLSATLGFLFGGVGSFLGFIGALAIIGVAIYYVHRLWKSGQHKWVLIIVAVAFLALGLAFVPLLQVNWHDIGFGFMPFLAFVLITALEAFIIQLALSNIPSRKRGTNH
ncbi:MAG: hypothetical protein ACREGE_02825 [Candidatus Microsaccharimonas sp.]